MRRNRHRLYRCLVVRVSGVEVGGSDWFIPCKAGQSQCGRSERRRKTLARNAPFPRVLTRRSLEPSPRRPSGPLPLAHPERSEAPAWLRFGLTTPVSVPAAWFPAFEKREGGSVRWGQAWRRVGPPGPTAPAAASGSWTSGATCAEPSPTPSGRCRRDLDQIL